MSEKEYIVSLKRDVDYDAFWYEIENISQEDNFVPSRRIDIVNNRDGSTRSCHYSLTDEEADLLRKDPRVYSVEIPPPLRDDIRIGLFGRQIGDFTKTSEKSGNYQNWGLKRLNSPINIYGTNFTTTDNYNYILDGSGVDVVIQDSGIEVYHSEFQDSNGQNRVQLIDWYSASGLAGTQNANHYRDYDGHGTHVAGIAAGKTFGWAKNARIYSVKVRGLEGSGDANTGISQSDCFDVIKLWHRNKPIDPRTGFKRPTIVNMSWGYYSYFDQTSLDSVTYRGTTYSDSSTLTSANYRWVNYGMVNYPLGGTIYLTKSRVGSVDVDVQELIDEGVHVCIAAGNYYHKIDVVGGDDYNNYLSVGGTDVYYHRGSSPYDNEALIVGSLDTSVISENEEQKVEYSETGPGVDLYACGANVMSSCSNINVHSGTTYYLDSSFKQTNIGGTSMASPQVCGIGAIYLQMNPGVSPAQLKNWLINNSAKGLLYDTNSTDYTNIRSLLGGNDRIAFNPFGVDRDGNLTGGIVLNNAALTLK